MNWKNKKVLVTGSEGLIGKELVEQLKEKGAKVFESDINGLRETNNTRNYPADLTHKFSCWWILKHSKPEFIFHLAGIKGNPKMTKERPADFMGPMLQFDTNMILAAQEAGVKRFLYTSSIAVEYPTTDWFPAWAKMTGEELIKAMRIQYPKGTKYCIVRPSNVYGRYDNFDNPDAMVVTNLISKAIKNKKIILDGKGSEQIRDFINAKDVARGMIKVMEQMPDKPVNLCSGQGMPIFYIAGLIALNTKCLIETTNLDLTLGPKEKVMKLNYDFKPKITLEKGIKEIIEYVNSRNTR